MMLFSKKRQIVIFTLGLVTLVGSFVVLGLTILRLQNPKPTITQPKATGLSELCPSGSDCANAAALCKNPPSCCSNAASCGWPDRGYCTDQQCDSVTDWSGACITSGSRCEGSTCPAGSKLTDAKCVAGAQAGASCRVQCSIGSGSEGSCVNISTPKCRCGHFWHNPDPVSICAQVLGSGGGGGGEGNVIPAPNGATCTCSGASAGNCSQCPAGYTWCYGGKCVKAGSGGGGNGTNKCGAPAKDVACADNCVVNIRVGNCSYCRACCAASNCTPVNPPPPPTCPSGQTPCNGVCKDLRTDPAHCGSCGSACTAGQTCTAGVCTSSGGSGSCVVPAQTHLACGANETCVRKKGAGNNLDGCTAVGANCNTTTCPSGQTLCNEGGVCKNLQTDPANCGSCGNACTVGQTCTAGVCATNNEINACWGNLGVNGRCYDCNGDGVINVLDFSCLAKRWGNSVQ